jgi:hypothetical protein
MSCARNSFKILGDAFEDLIGGLGPGLGRIRVSKESRMTGKRRLSAVRASTGTACELQQHN